MITQTEGVAVQNQTIIFTAKTIHTMNPSRPTATHVAVRDGRIVLTGSADDMRGLKGAVRDDRFGDKVLLPGFVEGHSHVMEGTLWSSPYVGAFDRRAPDGRRIDGLRTIDAIIARLKAAAEAMPEAEVPLYAWGYDPLHVDGRKLTRHDLDAISTTRPVMVHQASLHITNVNSLTLERAGFDAATTIAGVPKLEDGTPSGELQGLAARMRIFRMLGFNPLTGSLDEEAVRRYADAAALQGITTITDLHNDLPESTIEVFRTATAGDLKIRLVPALASATHAPEDGAEKIARLVAMNNERLHFGLVKIVVDGSIQGFTARLRWPGYHNGAPNGLWYVAPDDLNRIVGIYHRAGVHLHMHTNGDEATDAALDAVEKAQTTHPRPDHRHTLQHCQMANAAQFRRMKALGISVNLFANHIFYWGDAHYEATMGPERASRVDAAGTAERIGVPYAIHCDAPVTPLSPLFTAWCAVNRMTSSGRVLGPDETLTVTQALRAVTLGAAYTLKLDHCVGSIEAGKFADFAVLDEDPFSVPSERLKDVGVWGTVSGGVVHEAPHK
ncbi:MAG: amidohydrolase [Beijerinckiaceae bacterium]